jgi:FkbM family methyltransferase
MPAPIVLFVYNRVDYTKQTLEALARNELADQSTLFIYSDGPKANASPIEIAKVQAVRELIKLKSWCKEVVIVEREKNHGLANNIIDGVTTVLQNHNAVIVLEDDIVTSSGFLKYMNDALVLYAEESNVMHISGYMFPVKEKLPATFFYNTASCWGWATWSRAWKNFESDASLLLKKFTTPDQIKKFNVDDTYPFFDHLKQNASGVIKTWAVKWYASMFLNRGYALHCYPSLVNNIGNQGEGESGGVTSIFTWSQLAEKIAVTKIPIVESSAARKAMRRFNNALMRPGKILNAKTYLVRALKNVLPPIVFKIAHQLKPQNPIKQSIVKLQAMPRYEQGVSDLLGKPLRFVDSASLIFIYDEIFIKQIYKFNTSNLSPYIVDGGANIGLSVIYFKSLYPDAKIIAFEPDTKVFNALKYNVKSFELSDIELVEKALWDSETTLRFYSEGADGGRIATEADTKEIIQIPTVRLKKYLEKKVDFLKLDIEGAEVAVLRDCKDVLTNVERIFVEYHSINGKPQELDILLSILTGAGFRYNIHHIGVHSTQPFVKINDYEGMDLQLNIYGYRI